MSTPLNPSELAELRREFPDLPEEYYQYMETTGWGDSPSGRMIFSGPASPDSIYGPDRVSSSIVLLGDDGQGYCLGYDREAKQLGEVSDFGEWEPWPSQETLADYTQSTETN